jgi:hypothetical protein
MAARRLALIVCRRADIFEERLSLGEVAAHGRGRFWTTESKTEMPDEITSRGSKQESSCAQDQANAVSLRDRVVGAVFVLIVLAAQTRWMGLAIILLGSGLVLAAGCHAVEAERRSRKCAR